MISTLPIDPSARISVQIAGRLTCLCPVNGRRDEAAVEVTYTPAELVVELESFADYLHGFRDRVVTHEEATAELADAVRWAVMSDDVTVRTTWEPIEGIECVVTCCTSPPSA